jgi:hypothetical protein
MFIDGACGFTPPRLALRFARCSPTLPLQGRVRTEITMPNRLRGEIAAEIGGRSHTLVLTLGALAELESAFGADDLAALAERFGSGRMSARDLIRIIGAGLRGAGEAIGDNEVAAMTVPGGAAGFVGIAAELIAATFTDTPQAAR